MNTQVWSAIAAGASFASALIAMIVCIVNNKQNKITNKREQPNLKVFMHGNDSNKPSNWFFKANNEDSLAAVVVTFINPTKYPVTIQMCYLLVGKNRCIALQNSEVFDFNSLGLNITSVNGLPIKPDNLSFPFTLQPYGCSDSYVIFPNFLHSSADMLMADLQIITTFGDPDCPLTIHNISLYNLNNRVVEIPE